MRDPDTLRYPAAMNRTPTGSTGATPGGVPAALLLAATVTAACGPTVPNSPALDEPALSSPGGPTSGWATRVLDDRQREEVREAMRTAAGDRTAAEVGPGPAAAPAGRWRDLPDAVATAAGPLGIAVLATRFEPTDAGAEEATAIEFDLLTLANEPGRLRVVRREGPAIFEASAEIGLFRQRRELAASLVESIGTEVRRWGRKPELAPLDGAVASPR